MTGYEFLSVNRSILEVMANAAIHVSDIKYLDMYKEYDKMKKEGHKVTYIAYYLSEEYNVDKATFFRVIKKLNKEIILG